MTSYIGKVIVFFTIIYTLLIPSTMMNAFAEGNISHGKIKQSQIDNVGTQVNESSKKNSPLNDNKKDELQKTDNTPDYGKADAIGRNIQTAGQILSSSPSELAEQAKSYALGKINNTIASEAQKWLSQSSTAKINFGFDRKGSLENNSIDLLIPLYDNKADWFFFSQLGYRNKDSRNTVNFGLGERYFNQDWMYGLNTFYDYDITGQNRRVGLGGELWGDYIKFSANAYHRLSDWQMSRNFEEHHERPANGYDINGEFFLSAYPNLGGKLSYGQYFGENVTLFNRETKQRNPSQTKIGVTYTPIPLVTMGVDYKQGSGGQSETQFLTNFNFRLDVPLNTQLSPDNVASMRTLAGSRYDLVERENHIVLDHREIPKSELSVPERVVGYSHELQDISKELSANASIKQINIEDGNAKKEFLSSGGDIYLDSGRVYIKFPQYALKNNEINNYPLYISAELTNNQKTKPKQMQVIVRPFEIQKKEGSPPNFTPKGPLLESGDKGFTFDPIITFDAPANPNVVKNATIDNVAWFAIPVEKSASPTQGDNICNNSENKEKLAFTPNNEFKKIKIMDDGHIAVSDRVTLMSKGYAGTVAVCVTMDGQPKKFVGEVVFEAKSTSKSYHIKDNELDVKPSGPIIANGTDKYTYIATILYEGGEKVIGKEINKVTWSAKDKSGADITDKLNINGEFKSKTNSEGELIAEISSEEPFTDMVVSLAIEGNKPILAKNPVSFDAPKIRIEPSPHSPILVNEEYNLTATILDNSKEELSVSWNIVQAEYPDKAKLRTLSSSQKATLTSSVAQKISVEASIDNGASTAIIHDLEFSWPKIKVELHQVSGSIPLGGEYDITAAILDLHGNPYTDSEPKFEWSLSPDTQEADLLLVDSAGSSLIGKEVEPNRKGELTAKLKSKDTTLPDTVAKVCLKIVGTPELNEEQKKHQCKNVQFKLPPFNIASVFLGTMNKEGVFQKGYHHSNPLVANGNQEYAYQATVTNQETGKPIANYEFSKSNISWERDHNKISTTEFPVPEIISYKTNSDGQLYAKLKSYVGVDDVYVTLNLTNSGDTKLSRKADEPVNFEAESKPIGLYILNQYDETVHKFIPKELLKRPYIYFDSIALEFRQDENTPLVSNPDDYDIIFIDTEYNKGHNPNKIVSQSPSNKIRLNIEGYFGESKIIANVTNKESGAKYSYYYTVNFSRYFFTLDDPKYKSSFPVNDSHYCENSPVNGKVSKSPTKDQVVGSGIVFSEEYQNAFHWGLFSELGGNALAENAKFKVLKDSIIGELTGSDFLVYDAYNNKIVPNIDSHGDAVKAFLVCSKSAGE